MPPPNRLEKLGITEPEPAGGGTGAAAGFGAGFFADFFFAFLAGAAFFLAGFAFAFLVFFSAFFFAGAAFFAFLDLDAFLRFFAVIDLPIGSEKILAPRSLGHALRFTDARSRLTNR